MPDETRLALTDTDAARLALFPRLVKALQSLAKLDIGDDLTPDDDPRMVVGINRTYIRYGDVRKARALLALARKLQSNV